MTSTTTGGRGRRAADARRAGALRQGLGAAGRIVGAIARTTSPAARDALAEIDEDRRHLEGALEVVVAEGESVADLAARYGMSTAGVLALNGLGWRTPVAAGQVLLVRPALPRSGPGAEDLHRHRVEDGETVSGIAERHGVATAAVLLANGLSRGSVVRPGQHLVIPVANPRRTGSGPVVLVGDMRANAHLIVDAGRDLGVPDDGIVVALAAAMQDSSLRNQGFGRADAVGVFQQRPADGWGRAAQLLDPYRAALAFFGDPESRVGPPAVGLLDVDGWQFMSVGEAAAAVQGSGSPAPYGVWERSAREWLGELDREAGRR